MELPEDKLKAGMKERLVASMVSTHEETERMIDDIYKFEEKLKRTYFHVKPLDQKQLRVWDQYLDWQVIIRMMMVMMVMMVMIMMMMAGGPGGSQENCRPV